MLKEVEIRSYIKE